MLRSIRLTVFVLLSSLAIAQRGGVPSGPWSKNKIPDGWVVHNTKNYEIQSQVGIEKAKRLGDHMEAMNRVYRQLFRPDKDGTKQRVIKLLRDRDAYLGYGAPAMSAAYYSRSDREMVCYDTGKWSDEAAPAAPTTGPTDNSIRGKLARRMRQLEETMTMDILGCAAHEGWHQYFDWLVVSFVELPSWINEGMGDYFYTAAPKPGRSKKPNVELGGTNSGRLVVLKAAIRQNRFVPIERLISMSKTDFYNDASVCYAEGWAFCQFLMHSGNAKYPKLISNFIRFVRDDTNMTAVTERVFKGIDMAALETEFKAWIDTLKLDAEDEGIGDDEGMGGEKDG